MKISLKFLSMIVGILGNSAAAVGSDTVSAEDATARSTWIVIAYIVARAVENIAQALTEKKKVPVQ